MDTPPSTFEYQKQQSTLSPTDVRQNIGESSTIINKERIHVATVPTAPSGPLLPRVVFHANSSDEEDSDVEENRDSDYDDAQEPRPTVFGKSAPFILSNNEQEEEGQSSLESSSDVDEEWEMDELTQQYNNSYYSGKNGTSWFSDVAGRDQRTSHDRLWAYLKKDNYDAFNKYYNIAQSVAPPIRQEILEQLVAYFEKHGVYYRRVGAMRHHLAKFFNINYELTLNFYKDMLRYNRQHADDSQKLEKKRQQFDELLKTKCPDFFLILKLRKDDLLLGATANNAILPQSSASAADRVSHLIKQQQIPFPIKKSVRLSEREQRQQQNYSQQLNEEEQPQSPRQQECHQRQQLQQHHEQHQERRHQQEVNSRMAHNYSATINGAYPSSLQERELALMERVLDLEERKLALKVSEEERQYKRAKTRRIELKNLEVEKRLNNY